MWGTVRMHWRCEIVIATRSDILGERIAVYPYKDTEL